MQPASKILINEFIPTNSIVIKSLIVVVSSLLLAISARIQIPMYPVPFTMQSPTVLLLGAVLGRKLGTSAVLAYLTQGLAGMPVFASLNGTMLFSSPTGGYLIGFIFSAYFAGYFTEKFYNKSILLNILGLGIAHQLMFVFGVTWLAFFMGNFKTAFLTGYVPFVLFDTIKFISVAILVKYTWKASEIIKKI